jgi:hypothetical protein
MECVVVKIIIFSMPGMCRGQNRQFQHGWIVLWSKSSGLAWLELVIDRKRIFLFWPKTNIRQENAAEFSADNEYSAHVSKHCKKVNL